MGAAVITERVGELRATSVQTYARIAGVLFVLSIVAGGFGEAYVPSKVIVSGDATATANNIHALGSLFRWGFAIYLSGMPGNPITMFYVDDDRLVLTHYSDAGNRPRMEGRISPDRKSVEFSFLDVAGSTQRGFMKRMVSP